MEEYNWVTQKHHDFAIGKSFAKLNIDSPTKTTNCFMLLFELHLEKESFWELNYIPVCQIILVELWASCYRLDRETDVTEESAKHSPP